MDAFEFKKYRDEMGKTQKQIAQLLGVSLKAVKGYEQGWRNIPPSVERQLFFLIYQLRKPLKGQQVCWIKKDCHCVNKEQCPAFEFDMGHLCWFVNGTLCEGKPQSSWDQKIEKCRKCEMFKILL